MQQKNTILDDPDNVIDLYVLERIQYRVRKFALRFDLTDEQKEDVAHDMIVEVLSAIKRHDPSQSNRKTFINRVLDMFIRNAVRTELNRQRRQCDNPSSLDEIAEGFTPVVNDPRKGQLSDAEQPDMQMDLETILSRMPQHLRDICVLLKEYSVPEVARKLGKHRSTVYHHLDEIEKYFHRAGYDFSKIRATDLDLLQI